MADYKIELGIGLKDSDFNDVKNKIKSLENDGIKIKLDTSTVDTQIKNIKTQLQGLDNIRIDLGTDIKIDSNAAIKSAQQAGQKIGSSVTKQVQKTLNFDSAINKETIALMKAYNISTKGKSGKVAKDEIKKALTGYFNEVRSGGKIVDSDIFGSVNTADIALRKVTDAIVRNKKEVIELDGLYADLIRDIKSVNNSKGTIKISLPDMRSEWGDDYDKNKELLGSWFSEKYTKTAGSTGIDSWVKNKNWSSLLDLNESHQNIASQLIKRIKEAKAVYSGDELFQKGFLKIDDVEESIKASVANINATEQKMVQSSNSATDTIVQNQKRQQEATKASIEAKKAEIEQEKKRLAEINKSVDDYNNRFLEASTTGDPNAMEYYAKMQSLEADGESLKSHISNLEASYAKEVQLAQEAADAISKANKTTKDSFNDTFEIKNLDGQIDNLRNSLRGLNIDNTSISSITNDLEEMNVAAKSASATFKNGQLIKLDVNGIRESVDGVREVVRLTKTLNKNNMDWDTKIDISKPLEKTEKFIKQQKDAVIDLTNQINKLNREAIDQSAAKPIKDEANLNTLKEKYNEITSAIQRMGNASDDTFDEDKRNVRTLISEYRSLTRELRNAETVATSLRSKDKATVKATFASDLEQLIFKMKKDGVYTAGFEKGAENLRSSLLNANDKPELIAFLNGLDKLEAGYKRASAAKKEFNRSESVGIDTSRLESRITNLQRIDPEINKFKTEINGADVSVKSLLNDLGKISTQDDFRVVNKRLNAFEKAAEAAGITVKETVTNVKTDFNKLKSLAKEMGKVDIELAKVNNVDDFNSLKRLANELEAEYKDLYSTIGKNLNADQLRELDQIFANTAGAVRELNNEIAKSDETSELTSGLERLKSITKEINALQIDIFKFEDAENIQQATNRLNELENEAAELRATLQQKFNIQSFDEIDDIARQGKEALDALITKAEEAKAKLAKSIKADISLGNFDDEMDAMRSRFNTLSDRNDDLQRSIKAVETAYENLTKAANASTGDEIADRERLIQAEKEYHGALEKTNNLIKKQARADKIDADATRLQDNRDIFQAKIDSWMTKNSAATKRFGADLLDLRAKAEKADQVELNHLEKQLTKIDKAADKAGLKMQSFGNQIKSKFKEYMTYLSAAELFMWIEQGMREMYNTVLEIDTAMTGLYRVTDLTSAQYGTLYDNMISSAKEYGATLTDIINATTDWVRAGFDPDDALGLAEVTTMYQHISDLDYDTAAENLITAYNGFKNELDTAFSGDSVAAVEYIADIFNELDKQHCP